MLSTEQSAAVHRFHHPAAATRSSRCLAEYCPLFVASHSKQKPEKWKKEAGSRAYQSIIWKASARRRTNSNWKKQKQKHTEDETSS